MFRIAATAVVILVTSHAMMEAFAGESAAATTSRYTAALETGASASAVTRKKIDISALRSDYANCLNLHVKRYNDGTREAALVAEMTTHACAEQLHEIRWSLLSAGATEKDVTAYAARLQVRAREKLAEMVEYGF
ncbi:MAG: hypothetical protein RIC16_17235 [Rhodospirillales bacterium]